MCAFYMALHPKFHCVAQYCHDTVLIYWASDKGISAEVIRIDVPESLPGAQGVTPFSPPVAKDTRHGQSH